MAEDALSQYVGNLKVSPKQREEILDAGKRRARDMVRRARLRNEAAMTYGNKPVVATVVSAAGGAAAELVRRNGVGRFTKDCRAQGLGLILAGGAVSWVGKKIAFVPQIGQAHAALGGAVLAASMYGTKEKPDPLKEAYELTTWKHKNDKK